MIHQCCKANSKFKPVTHVIFDLDGTLIDSEGVYAEALQKTIEDYGKTYPPNFTNKIAGTVQKDVARVTIESLNIDTTIDEFLKLYTDYANKKLGDLNLMQGAEKFVKHLYNNNIPIAIATSSQVESMRLKTEKHKDLFSLFSHIVSGGSDPEVKAGKPAPDIFLICASRFSDSPDPSKCLVFEDSTNGVKAALAAGMQVVMIPDNTVPYAIWKTATIRLDSFNYMIPQLFGLPPFPPGGSTVFPQNLEEEPAEPTILAGFKEEHVPDE